MDIATGTTDRRVEKRAYVEIFFGIVLLGTGPMFVKFVRANGTQVAFYRLLFAALMLALPALLARKKEGKDGENGRPAGWLIAGGTAFAINIALWCSALNYAPAAVVTLLDNTAPVWVGLFAWLVLRQQPGGAYWAGLGLAVAGGALLVSGGVQGAGGWQPIGTLLSLLSGLSYAAYILITQRARRHFSSWTYSWMVSVVGALVLFAFGMLTGAFAEGLPARSYALIFLMSLSSQVLGWYLVNEAFGKLPPTAAAAAMVGQPVVTTLLGILLLGELLSAWQWMGAAVCLAGILLAQRSAAPA